jgi:hypothetical protein
MGPHFGQEGLDLLLRIGIDQLTVIKPEADPEVVHKRRKSEHDTGDAEWAAKFVLVMLVEAAVDLLASLGHSDFFVGNFCRGSHGEEARQMRVNWNLWASFVTS